MLATLRLGIGSLILLINLASTVQAESSVVNQEESEELEEILVRDVPVRGRLRRDDIIRIEALPMQELKKKKALTFSQLIDGERGVDSQTSCAFCGAKRITINGMRGEHTTILVDGLSLHSTISSFYGVEAIPLGGIDSIEVYRGSGAALTAPESIGGAINIITTEPTSDRFSYMIQGADDGQKQLSLTAQKRTTTRSGFLVATQNGEIMPLDLDKNGIREIPGQKIASVMIKGLLYTTDHSDLSLRASQAALKTTGGTGAQISKEERAGDALVGSTDFVDGDIRNAYTGQANRASDQVGLHRHELALIFKSRLSPDHKIKIGAGMAAQQQNAIYSHGYDYSNSDTLGNFVVESQFFTGENHLWTIGVDHKTQDMKSKSIALYDLQGLARDDLRYRSYGGYIQHSWFADDRNELSLALRADNIETTWLDLNRDVKDQILAPRLFYKHLHSETLTSRFAAGLGYRAPLTLFESQHGTNHRGFEIDIERLEKALSLVYSLAGQWLDDFFELSVHRTTISDMAYGLDRADTNAPTLFQHAEESYEVLNYDLSYGHRFNHEWNFESSVEFFNYEQGYKEKLPIAAIEERFTLGVTFEDHGWKVNPRLSVIGARDLKPYRYDRHYNIASIDEDIFSETFGETTFHKPKRQKAPAFYTIDMDIEKKVHSALTVGLAIHNLTNYTQTEIGDSPTTWHRHGNHYHLDNFHLWGPLRPRQVFLSLNGEF